MHRSKQGGREERAELKIGGKPQRKRKKERTRARKRDCSTIAQEERITLQ